jgi:hypothetical protein
MGDANWDELRRNRGGNRVEGGGTDHTVIVLPMRPKVLEKDDKHLVLLQDTSCGWICVPCIPWYVVMGVPDCVAGAHSNDPFSYFAPPLSCFALACVR